MPHYPIASASKLEQDLTTAQAALDALKRQLNATVGDEPAGRWEARTWRTAPRARPPVLRFGAVLTGVGVLTLAGIGLYGWRQQAEQQEQQLAQAQVVMDSPACQKLYRAKAVVSEQTDICLAAAHVVEGR